MRLSCLLIAFLAIILPFAVRAESAIPQSHAQITLTFAPLVKQAAPAVVNIYARKRVEQQIVSPLLMDPFFRRFFEGQLPPGTTRQRMEASLGSGVIVRPDGLIVTSNHVIAGADEIRVVLSDRREFDAKVTLADDQSDLAVLRIEAKGEKLPFLELRDSDEAQVGDLVLAIGNPFGVGQTVTSGIISATARTGVTANNLNYFIQTDAAINPGNSGGALITTDGKLVGINAAIYSRDGGNLGIGFAVPSNMVRVVLNGVEAGKKSLIHPWTGIGGQEVTAELAASLGLAQPEGILVNVLHPVSPAAKAGLKVGDVITSINGRSIEDIESFRYRIATLPVSSEVVLGIFRKGQKLEISFKLISPPEDPPRDQTIISGNNPLSGAVIANVSPAVSEEIGLRGVEQGVVVTAVKDNTPASNLGMQLGDLVLRINNAKILSVSDAVAALKQQGQGWRMTIQRGENVLTVMVGR